MIIIISALCLVILTQAEEQKAEKIEPKLLAEWEFADPPLQIGVSFDNYEKGFSPLRAVTFRQIGAQIFDKKSGKIRKDIKGSKKVHSLCAITNHQGNYVLIGDLINYDHNLGGIITFALYNENGEVLYSSPHRVAPLGFYAYVLNNGATFLVKGEITEKDESMYNVVFIDSTGKSRTIYSFHTPLVHTNIQTGTSPNDQYFVLFAAPTNSIPELLVFDNESEIKLQGKIPHIKAEDLIGESVLHGNVAVSNSGNYAAITFTHWKPADEKTKNTYPYAIVISQHDEIKIIDFNLSGWGWNEEHPLEIFGDSIIVMSRNRLSVVNLRSGEIIFKKILRGKSEGIRDFAIGKLLIAIHLSNSVEFYSSENEILAKITLDYGCPDEPYLKITDDCSKLVLLNGKKLQLYELKGAKNGEQ
ncbi:MAG: hypothetical protein PHX54_13510 [Lentimicrobiaceae bacterium]|nr:hypothetical protein [Lentimicrobiaceae bacterium]